MNQTHHPWGIFSKSASMRPLLHFSVLLIRTLRTANFGQMGKRDHAENATHDLRSVPEGRSPVSTLIVNLPPVALTRPAFLALESER